MKELKNQFTLITRQNPELSSFICFQRACRKLKLNKQQIAKGFQLVDKDDYRRNESTALISHIFKCCG